MSAMADLVTSSEAAERLGVSARQVQRLIANGTLTVAAHVGRTALIDAVSVQRLRARGAGRGRPWSGETIAAAIDLLTDGSTQRLAAVEVTRLRKRLTSISAEELVAVTRMRARVQRYRASASFLKRIADEVTMTGAAAIDADTTLAREFGLASSGRGRVDGYVDAERAGRIVSSWQLVADPQGNVTLRETQLDALREVRVAPTVVVALDLADSLDTRERAAGLGFLRHRLKAQA